MSSTVIFARDNVRAEVIAGEGALLSNLEIDGQRVLAETPWANTVSSSSTPAPDEKSWVSRWRGGWQLCAPNTGSADAETNRAAFHGAASQANWTIVEQTDTTLKLSWMDPEGEIELVREWSFNEDCSVSVHTTATNKSKAKRPVGFAEHLILGSRFLQPVQRGSIAKLTLCPASKILDLDYSGAPTGLMIESAAIKDFTELSASQPAKVFVVSGSKTNSISVQVDDWVARVEWQGLDHALVWQEFGTSAEAPWNSEVFALGIEPTNVPHGLGANEHDGPFLLVGEAITWNTSVQFFRKADDSDDSAT